MQSLIPHGENVEFPRQVDSSMMGAFDACEIKGFVEYVLHLSPSATSIDLHAGGAFAAAIERVRRGLWQENLDLRASICEGLRTFIQFWGDYQAPEGHAKSFVNVFCALVDYFTHYDPRLDPIKPYIMQTGAPAVEFTFALPTEVPHPETGDPILYCGRFDLLGYFNDALFIIDEKTSGRAPFGDWSSQYSMRGQFIGYNWAARTLGFKTEGALVRLVVIQKTQYQQHQAIVSIPEWQVDRWYSNLNYKLDRFARAWKQGDWRYSYGDACSSYGGCAFLPLCTQRDPTLWLGDYQHRHWNPLAKDPTKLGEEK